LPTTGAVLFLHILIVRGLYSRALTCWFVDSSFAPEIDRIMV
jgi:hypothetical protein